MKFKHWITNRPSVGIAVSVTKKVRRDKQPEPERWVITQTSGNHSGLYWRGSSVKAGSIWTANPQKACHYPTKTVALYDAQQMNQRHMKLRYSPQKLD
jgi:hypothetical protein